MISPFLRNTNASFPLTHVTVLNVSATETMGPAASEFATTYT